MTTQTQHLVEDHLVGWIIESNHLVDALLEADRGEIVDIMQRRYGAAYQTVLALRQHVDAQAGEMAELRIRIAQHERWAEEIEQQQNNAEVAAGLRDNNGNQDRPTAHSQSTMPGQTPDDSLRSTAS